MPLKITDVKTILTAPAGIRLVVVKVLTDQPGLYGLGCATFTQRARVVQTAVDEYLRPFLLGKNPLDIEDIWQSAFVSSYWRNGPVLNNALSGVDMALWDILGKVAGVPVYQLLGGKCRSAVDTYRHASGSDFQEVEDQVRGFLQAGYRHVRAQVAIPGMGTYGSGETTGADDVPENRRTEIWEPRPYVRAIPRLFEHLRNQLGDEVELIHDVHERVPPILAMGLAKDLEQHRLFYLEDPFSPEDAGYFSQLRQQSSTPLAMGELFNNPHEWIPLVSGRLIDFMRVHISQIGGLTPARKMAAMCELFGVRTAWHGPGDVSPVGHAANIHLDLAVPNFGIQEAHEFNQAEQDVFPGCPELRDGYYDVNDGPGLGIDIDETLAAKFPITDAPPFDMFWGNYRRADGTSVKP
ncbi:Starvation-sensing protein RspA [Symmachiella macrocystis]|uniref:Starvation-sensing protein RspA n=1 Tax=Symmachiella macrocystis TaxID=2527985 RepID=A0A5C6BPZ3_9PLAN|nr:enolase C-terminal domain-like protein [Symmachiella macrocystis]TWU14095.1 Starvation-sensing protein RspA [Symmachiella macrocystis]